MKRTQFEMGVFKEQPAVAVSKAEEQVQALEAAGMTAAASKLREAVGLRRKLAVAYEHYRFVKPEKIEAFRKKLHEATRKAGSYKDLSFTPLEKYTQVPPADVVQAVVEARGRQCFDSFEVAHIIEVKDPIVFGRVNGCADRFFIAQWDDDVRIEDILRPEEG